MPAEVNGNHVVAHFNRARVILRSSSDYLVCGNIVITPHFVFMSGHGSKNNNFEPVVSIAVSCKDVQFIVDHSVEACETHDKMDAEAKAQMEAMKNAENKED